MSCIAPGQHGSTYGGNPLACAVACTALDVLVDEDLVNRSARLGERFRGRLRKLMEIEAETSPEVDGEGKGEGKVDGNRKQGFVTAVRGKGLMNAIDVNPGISRKGRGAWHLCLLMLEKGVLAKPTHEHTM